MSHMCLCVALAVSVLILSSAGVTADDLQPPYHWQTFEFTQVLDHFNWYNGTRSYQQRYLVNDTWYRPGGPVFFYTGNEGPIELFADSTGLMWDLAPDFGALLVFAEHRYYGSSLPYGNETYSNFKSPRLSYLSSEQALADYATLLPVIKAKFNAPEAPVIAFGGSYGGCLAAWFRIKYPWIVHGSIASSAPVLHFVGSANPAGYNQVLTWTFGNASASCPRDIYKAWGLIEAMSVNEVNSMFTPCTPLTSKLEYSVLFEWLVSALDYMTMADYPYPTKFLGPLPAWPVKHACSFFEVNDPVMGMRELGNLFFNYTGQEGECFNLNQPNPPTLHPQGGWSYQACTEMVMPKGQYGPPTDMFMPKPWNYTWYRGACQNLYGVTPRPHWIETQYGGPNLKRASNIVFSSGMLDPWWSGAVHTNNSANNVWAISIAEAAHHLDLRASNPADPASVVWARQFEAQAIETWIEEYRAELAAEVEHEDL